MMKLHFHQRGILHLEDSIPNHLQHLLDQTIEGHTWPHHEELLACDLLLLSVRAQVTIFGKKNDTDKTNTKRIINLIQCCDSRRKASMDTKDFVFNKCRQAEKRRDLPSDLIYLVK